MKNILIMMVAAMLLAPCLLFGRGTPDDADVSPQAEPVQEEAEPGVLREYPYINYRFGEQGTVEIGGYNEAPLLSAKVAAGELPSVSDRLPQAPLVLEPLEEIGEYGGTFVSAWLTSWGNSMPLTVRLLHEFLVNYTTPYLDKIIPNVAKDWETNEDMTEIVFYLREGMKWSDGAPFTADDILFWYEAIIKNDELYPSKPGGMMTAGELGLVKKIDDYAVEFSFSAPNVMFLEQMARWRPEPYAPAHYLKQFHPDYASKETIEKMMKSEGFDRWADFFRDKWDRGKPDYPTISAWKAVNDSRETPHILERNPYYWKIDTEGNQMPYIDGTEHPSVSSNETWLLKAMAGDLTSAMGAYIGGIDSYPIVMQNREKGDYRVSTYMWPPNQRATIFFNFQHEDPVIRKLFLDKRFRIALSIALDRDEINELVFDGLATPSQPSSSPGAPYFGEGPMFKRYLKYDPKEANRLLDEVGLADRDKEGFRLRPDGKNLIISMTVGQDAEVAEMYKKYWEEVGIRVVTRVQTYALMIAAEEAGSYDLSFSGGAWGGRPLNILTRGTLFPTRKDWRVSQPWAAWVHTNGQEGVEPPYEVKRLYELYVQGVVEPSEEKRTAIIMEGFDIYIENLYAIGGFNQPEEEKYRILKNSLRNVHRAGEPHAGELFPAQPPFFFFKQ